MKWYVRKYKRFGEWTEWKEVSEEVAQHKAKVVITALDDFDDEQQYCPYEIKAVEM